ncbi:FMRFamide-related peptides type HF-4-like [Homarus americanus]|uniref:FMRFamide-related peptides type HF-4-like n=1 Tax=Homarus americanus TaxID=6706 RepID=UPI001C459FD2|nr:FMRFamide-related peptides type HF-4-like [Homarus americanus]
MIVAAWVLLTTLTWCCQAHAAPVPPVVAALDPPTDALLPAQSQEDDLFALPEKRLLKYFLPASQAWGGDAYPIGQEGTKRGYSDRNYLRFGRSDDNSKRSGRNFLRFGRSDTNDYEGEEMPESPEKRNRNFLRFGRDQNRNFLRFGRSGSPMEFATDLQEDVELPVEEKRGAHKNYLRFGRGNRNFLRFGRGDRNFLRFGRSVDRQLSSLSCEDCDEEQKAREFTSTPSPTTIQPLARTKRDVSAVLSDDSIESSVLRQINAHRIKRAAAQNFYIPMAWASELQPEEDGIDVTSFEEPQVAKRFSHDRNFLRFGKRDGSDDYPSSSSSAESPAPVVVVRPVEYPRYVRAPSKNFLRFG